MSSLSASATVFVPGKIWVPAPRQYTAGSTVPPQQQWAGAGPPVFVPGQPWAGGDGDFAAQPQQWSNGDDQSPYVNSGWEPDYVIMVKDMLYNLSINPGLFEDYMRSMAETLNATITTDEELGVVADIIFEQSVLEPNFRYTGARTCDYLMSHLILPPTVNKFRSHINQRVKEAVEHREKMAKDAEKMTRLHGATMFLAELFLNSELHVLGENHPQRIKIYRTALKELMDTLVNNASSENLKCLGLLLKLSGKEIEDYDKDQSGKKASEQLNEIFIKARWHVTNEAIDKSVRELWLQLIELRAARWGQGDGASYGAIGAAKPTVNSGVYVSSSGDTASAAVFNSQPVFYNQQGQVISAAEAGFGDDYDCDFDNYADYQNYDDYTSADAYPNYAPGDPYSEYDMDPSHYQQGASAEPDYADDLDELDAEIQAAFSDFLIETGQGDHS